MLERVAATITRYGMFSPGQRVGVAVSGGADSVCLLHLLAGLAPRWNLTLRVLHVNHHLRAEASDADEMFVRSLAERFGFEFELRSADTAQAAAETGDNLEQAARRIRREFFLELLGSGALDRVALGHTRSDQAETVLFRFLRGAGTAGLAGMRPATGEGLVRPLIESSRDEVLAYLREREVAWREDASNQDRTFARNRIRHDLLPALEREWNPALAGNLAETARVAADEETYWEEEIGRVTAGRLVERPPAVLFEAAWLRALAPAVARRALRRAIETAKGDLRSIDLLHVERILSLTNETEGSGRLQIPGLDVFRSFDWVRLAPPGIDRLEDRNYELEVSVPGRVSLPGGRGGLALELAQAENADSVYNKRGRDLDWGRISGELHVRNWRPGDRYRPVGHSFELKIKLLFQQARVPLWERRSWPVLTCDNSILWAAGFGPAEECAADDRTRMVLIVREFAHGAEL